VTPDTARARILVVNDSESVRKALSHELGWRFGGTAA